MHQTRKGNVWRFGMKCHVGVDAGSGLVHAITVTPANECDITETVNLIREDDQVVYGDSGYLGVQKRLEIKQNEHLSSIDFRINRRPKSLPKVSDHAIDWERYIEHRKSSICSKVEHVFQIIKCQFGYRKVVYRGLKKNENRFRLSTKRVLSDSESTLFVDSLTAENDTLPYPCDAEIRHRMSEDLERSGYIFHMLGKEISSRGESMEMYVDHQLHLVSIWLPNDEKDVTILEPVYRKYKGTPYRVAVFRSGKGNLLTNTAAMLKANR